MREYINVYQLDDIGDKARIDDYLLISQDALSYKIRLGVFRDFVIDNVDVTQPIFNAGSLNGYNIEFDEPINEHDLLTYDGNGNWVNRPLDINAVLSASEYEPNKFLKLDDNKTLITSDIFVEDLIVDSSGVADHFLAVDSGGGTVVYVDMYNYINETIDERSESFIPLLEQEILRATSEEQRIELLLQQEIQRSKDEDLRIENKFDIAINELIETVDSNIESKVNELASELDAEIDRATNEEERITDSINDEIIRATGEEQRIENKFDSMFVSEASRLENLIIAGDNSIRSDFSVTVSLLENEDSRLNDEIIDVNARLDIEIDRATTEERRLENMILDILQYTEDEIGRIDDEIGDVNGRLDDEIERSIDEDQRLSDLIDNLGDVEATPDTLVLRDQNGTSKFSEPTNNQHPIRQGDVVDNLNSTTTNRPLSANQGRILDEKINSSEVVINDRIDDLGDVEATPNTLVLRDQNGTSKFSEPTHNQHPIRRADTSTTATAGSVVQRNSNGTAAFGEPTANPHPIRQGDVVDNLSSTATNRPLSANQGRILDERVNSTEDFIDTSNTNTFGSIGQTFFIDKNNTPNSFSPDYTLISDPSIVETTAELIAQEEFVSDFRRVFDSWKRFSHYTRNGDGGPQPVNPSEINAWSYDEDENRLETTVNSTSIIGFVSPDVHENYTLQSLVSSDHGDDDFIGLCAAFVTNSGYESAIYVSRTVGAGNIASFNQFGGGLFNIVAQITTESGTQFIPIAKINGGLKWGDGVVDDSRQVENGAYGGWNDWYGCVIRIDRNGDEFTCRTSNLMADENDSRAFVNSATVTFSLNDDPRLSIFKGKQSYGYVSFSQRNSTWVSDIRPAPIQTVYNMETSEIWKWNGSQFQVDNSADIDDIFDIGRFYHNELTRQLYYYHHENGLRILRGAVGDGLTGTGTEANPTSIKLSPRSGNLLQLNSEGLYYGVDAPPDLSILYVAAAGDDSNPGTREQPLKTLAAALSKIPQNVSNTIRLKAGETFDMPRARVSGATRRIEPYDDPYLDGNMVPDRTPTVWYYEKYVVNEINRPNITFNWRYDNVTNTAELNKLFFDNGGIWEFLSCNIIRTRQINANHYTSTPILGSPSFYNGVFRTLGCKFIDDTTTQITSNRPMFEFRRDSGSVTLNLNSSQVQINDTSKRFINCNQVPLTLTAHGTIPPTPVPVSGITPFEDDFMTRIGDLVHGINRINGVPVNLVTNIQI